MIIEGMIVDRDATYHGWVKLDSNRVLQEIWEGEPPQPADFTAGWIAPGLWDVQVNGAAGVNFTDSSPDSFRKIGEALLRRGTTSYLGTIISNSVQVTTAALHAAEQHMREVPAERRALKGVHCEGPYLNPEWAGAHQPEFLRSMQEDPPTLLYGFPAVRMVTLAPELPGGQGFVEWLQRRGVVVSAGHSSATPSDMTKMFTGAHSSMITHLFNAMPGFHHREGTLPGWVLTSAEAEGINIGVIADGEHLSQSCLRLIAACAKDRVVLTSDLSAGAFTRNLHMLQAGTPIVSDSWGRVRTEDGFLAGSSFGLNHAVRMWSDAAGVDFGDALRAGSWRPAVMVEGEDVGLLTPGVSTDLTVWDESKELAFTVSQGRIIMPPDAQ